jgi:hypothetical protein
MNRGQRHVSTTGNGCSPIADPPQLGRWSSPFASLCQAYLAQSGLLGRFHSPLDLQGERAAIALRLR